MKKIRIWLIVLAMLMTACTPGGSEDTTETSAVDGGADSADETDVTQGAELTDGTYTQEVNGYGGPMEVAVTVTGGDIAEVEVTDHHETPGVGRDAIEKIIPMVIEHQTTEYDAVSGATVTSFAMRNAIRTALTEAGAAENDFTAEMPAQEYESQKEADVVIVGGGGAGLAAAVSATEEGASVIVLEKTGLLGGNTIVCGGIYNAPDPELQGAQGIEDSPELFMQQTLEGGDNVANPELVEVLTSNAYDGLQWLKGMGVEFEDTIIQGAGSLYPRTHQAVEPLGTGFIQAYVNQLEQADAEILLNTKGESLIVTDGKVTGVNATNPDGSTLELTARNGVIIATGGFSKNMDMVMEYNTSGKWPDLSEDVVSTNRDAITGDGILMAEEAGADLVDMEQIQFLYLGIPGRGQIDGLYDLGAENTIFVNNQGERFVREDGRRDVISKAIFEQEDGQMWYMHSADVLSDEDTGVSLEGVPMLYLIENGVYGWVKGETIEDLAEAIGCDAATLQATIDDYNEAVETGTDAFGRELLTKKMETGPWYALPRVPSLHHTMGGLRIDTETRVVDPQGNPIEGLYAAGEVTGGIHGANRLGANAVADTVVFGRLAGEAAANSR